MEKTKLRAMQMVRRIRDAHHEQLKDKTWEERVAFYREQALDFDDKFGAYFKIESLREYWIIDPERVYVRQCVRASGGVLITLLQDLEAAVESPTLNVSVPLSEIYRRTSLAS